MICILRPAQSKQPGGRCRHDASRTRQRAAQELRAILAPMVECRSGEIEVAEDRPGQVGPIEPRGTRDAMVQLRALQSGAGEVGIAQLDMAEHRVAQAGVAKRGATQVQRRRIGRRGDLPVRQLRAVQHEGRRWWCRVGLARCHQHIGKGQFADARAIGAADLLQRRDRCRIRLGSEQLAEEIQGLRAGLCHVPGLGAALQQRTVQIGGEEEFLQRGVREAEVRGALAHQKSRGAQVLLQQLAVLALVVRRQVRAGAQKIDQPLLQVADAPGAFAGAVQRGGEMFHQQLLVVRRELVFSGVALQPGQHHVAIQHGAGDGAAFQLPALDVREVAGDQAERVGALREFRQVVHRADGGQRAVHIRFGEGLAEVGADLVVSEGEQDEDAVVVAA